MVRIFWVSPPALMASSGSDSSESVKAAGVCNSFA